MAKFDYSKLFRRKDIDGATVLGIDELARVFTGSAASWNTTEHMRQYGKSLYVFAAINKIALKTSAIDFQLYRITSKEGDSEEILDSEILDLVMRFNPFQTRTEFLKMAWINKKLTGEAIWLKVRNKEGKVIELWNLRPDLMTVVTDPQKFIKAYELQKADGGKETFDPADIIHFREPNPLNPWRGMSPLAPAQHRIETEQLANKYQRNFFGNNARPDALLLSEETLDSEQRDQMTEAWEDRHQGANKGGRIGILEGGMQYQQVSISQKEMDYIESMKFTRDDILVALGVPKSVITTDDVNFANADAGIRMFLSETITPEMKQIVEVLNEFLVSPDFGEEYYLDFQDPTPADRKTQTEEFTAGYGRWLTTNEIRATLNLAPIEGGDVIPTTNRDGKQTGEIGGETNPPKGLLPREAQLAMERRAKALKMLQGRPFLRKKLELIRTVGEEITKQTLLDLQRVKTKKKVKNLPASEKASPSAKTEEEKPTSILPDIAMRETYYDYTNKKIDKRSKQFEKKLVSEFAGQEKRVLAKMDELDAEKSKGEEKTFIPADISKLLNKAAEVKLFSTIALPFLEDFATRGGKDAADMTGEQFDMTDSLAAAIKTRANFFAGSITDTTFEKLTATLSTGINNGEGIAALKDRVTEVYGQIPSHRAFLIARTETTFANNEGMLAQFKESSVVKGKEWVATLDSRTRDEHVHLNGKVVGLTQTFENGLQFPQEPNCRCVLAPALISAGKAWNTPMRKRAKKA